MPNPFYKATIILLLIFCNFSILPNEAKNNYKRMTLYGIASWYGPNFHGRLTANGEIFNKNMLTAAHKSLPFNTMVQVTNLRNKRSIVVRINDRGPYIPGRMIDLSESAARKIGLKACGIALVKLNILNTKSRIF